MDIRATLQQAMALHQQRKFGHAEKLYREILAIDSSHPSALHHLGLIAGEAGQWSDALQFVMQSIRLDPTNYVYRVNYIGLLDASGQPQVAQDAARQLVAERPDDLKLRAEYAKLLMKHGNYDVAAAEWETLSKKASNDPAVLFYHAYTLELAGSLIQAEQRYRDTLALKPDLAEAMVNLAGILAKTGRRDQSIPLLEKAAQLQPQNAVILSTLGVVLADLGRLTDGLDRATAAFKLAPREPTVLRNMAYTHVMRGEVAQAIALYKNVCMIVPQLLEAHSDLLMTSLYVEADGADELKLYRRFGESAAALVTATPPPPRELAPGERFRIGYVSPDFRMHPVGYFIEPLLAAHDRGRFEIHCFSTSASRDQLTLRLQSHVDSFHDAHALTINQLDALIRSEQIDILVDLTGHSGGNRMGVFAKKPATVQATYLGYPNTTGLAAIDIRITDAVADPAGYADTIHTERLVRLPQSFGLFAPLEGAPAIAPLPSQSNGFITFGSLGRHEKWQTTTLASWARILKSVPNSRLRLIGAGMGEEAFRQQLLSRLGGAGIDASRVDLIARLPFNEYLAEISKIDLLLDTYPFNGHTTTLQALYMGVPTVTLAGKVHRSRMGASVMHAMGLPDLVANSGEEYEEIAVGLAKNANRLTELRNTLRDRLLGSSLCDAPGFARAFEACLVDAWKATLPTSR